MRILIVDDNLDKIKSIMQVLCEVDGVEENYIEYSIDTNSALQKTLETLYDLLILDLKMPERIIDGDIDDAGASFIDELMYTECYKKPIEIVVMSAYERCEKTFIENNNRIGFKFLRYDESSNEWKSKLKSIIEYRIIYNEQIQTQEIPYAIITTTSPETDAVKKLCENWKTYQFNNDVNTYYAGDLKDGDNIKKIVTVQCCDMGMVSATVTALNLYLHFKPKYIFIVGIAAGIDNQNIGDIIVPNEVRNYTTGKYCERDGKSIFIPEPKILQLDSKIVRMINCDHSEILSEITKESPFSSDYILKLHSTPMACGSAVIASKSIVDEQINEHYRKSAALDMESYGVFYAAQSLCDNKPIAICVKSISDHADGNKNNNRSDIDQAYASYTSAYFTKYLILNYL